MRTTHLLLAALSALAGVLPGIAFSQNLSLPQLRELRTEAAQRPRRMIFNNDGDDMLLAAEPTVDALLVQRTSALEGSQVDSIFYGGIVCFGSARYASEVMPPFTVMNDEINGNSLPGLLANGIDPVQVMVDFCHERGLEMFWDMRMNDTHDAGAAWMLPQWKLDHPECLVGAADKRPPYGTWSSVDFAMPAVRDLAYEFIAEACRRYDLDGIELDFFRHPCFFRTVAWGGEATQAELDQMTELMRRVREMTEQEGIRRGRPILVAIRVPDSVEYCRAIGLDLEKWLADGLVDLLIGTCYFQLNPWEYLVDLGHRYGAQVYPSLSESRVRGETRFRRNSMEAYRGRALRAWAAGVDGIYMFNYFNPKGPAWRELGDPQGLLTRDRLYFATVRAGSPGSYVAGGQRFCNIPILTPTAPLALDADNPAGIDLLVGEDFAGARPAGEMPAVTLHLRALSPRELNVTLNGHQLGTPTLEEDWRDYPVPPEWVVRGANAVTVALAPGADTQTDWDVVYDGAAVPGAPWMKDGFSAGDLVVEPQEGALLIADRGEESGSYAYFRAPCAIKPELETTIEARVKAISGTSNILIENGVTHRRLVLTPDAIRLSPGSALWAMDTTDAFHDYRIVLQGTAMRVYVDGELRLSDDEGPGPGASVGHGVWFGAASSTTRGEALWQSVRICNQSVPVLDMVLSVRHPRG